MELDPRLTPARPDRAAAILRGQVEAPLFVAGEQRVVIDPVAPVRRAPAPDAPLDTEALRGEAVTVYDADGEGWSWVQLARDSYVGYVPSDALAPAGPAPTHRIAVPRTFLFPAPDIKQPPRAALPFGAHVAAQDEARGFLRVEGGFVFAAHTAPPDACETDVVAVALRFLETPYLWGGRSAFGLDCSGLVQTALTACGLACPRDSDMQEAALGTAIDPAGPFERGDLLFWPGHVAIVEAPDSLLHANAHHMRVAREPIGPALERIAQATPLRSARRLTGQRV